jgi:hypothetical protein
VLKKEFKFKQMKQQMTGKTGKYIVSVLENKFFGSDWEPIRQCVGAGIGGSFFDYKIFNSMEEIYEHFFQEYPTIKKECFQFTVHPGNKIIVPVNPLS